MLKKCLIALAIISMLAGSVAQAHPSWGVTTAMAYDWAKKKASVDVYIKVVRWAKIYTKYAVVLTQQQDGSFCGCTWIQVCCNFKNLRIDAKLVLSDTDNVNNLAEKWFLAMLYAAGEDGPLDLDNPPTGVPCVGQQYVQVIGKGPAVVDKATMVLAGPHLTGSLAYVQLCVKAMGVDPQAMEFMCDPSLGSKANIRRVATVKLTYYPNDPPSACDWAESFTNDPAGYEYESGLPNVPGGIPNGDGQKHDLPASPNPGTSV